MSEKDHNLQAANIKEGSLLWQRDAAREQLVINNLTQNN